MMFAAQAVRLLASYALLGLLYLYRSAEDIALYANFIAVLAVITPFLVLKPEALVGRAFFLLERTAFENYSGSAMTVILAASFAGLLLAAAAGKLVMQAVGLPPLILLLMPLYAIGYGWNYIASTILQLTKHPALFAMMRGGEGVVRLGIGAVLILGLGLGGSGSAVAVTGASLVVGGASYWLMRRHTDYRLPINWAHARDYIIMGGATVPMTVGAAIMQGSDKLFMTARFGLHDAGVYAFGSTIAGGLWIVANAFQQVWMPFLFRTLNDASAAHRRQAVMAIVLFIGFMLIVSLILIVSTMLAQRYILRPEYRELIGYFPILVLANCVSGVRLLFDNIYYYYGKMLSLSVIVCAGAGLSIMTNALLIPRAGAIGGALAMLISMTITCAATAIGALLLVRRKLSADAMGSA